MTDANPVEQVAPPTRKATSGKISKLRDSCHACALSKVKCHKEKPSCSRCIKRGSICEYFATKRPGRKRDSGQATKNNSHDTIKLVVPAYPIKRNEENEWPGTTSTTAKSKLQARNSYLTPPGFVPTSPGTGTISEAELDMFMTPMESSLVSALAGMTNEFDDFFSPPIDFPKLEQLDHEFIQDQNDVGKLLIPGGMDLNPALESASTSQANASRPSSPFSNCQTFSTSAVSVTDISDLNCSCLMQTLDFMKKLSSCKTSSWPTSDTGRSSNPSTQIVIAENKSTIEIVSNILQCSCAEDGYLLTMLSMVVFNILGRYATAVHEEPEQGMKRCENLGLPAIGAQLNNYYHDGEDSWRMTAQLVLNELHRVQQLVNQLSPRLRRLGFGEARKGSGSGAMRNERRDNSNASLLNGETGAIHFATTLDQIEVDLRKCLSNLSLEIITMLRES
ncbi:aflatoxin regulatory protein-domain-containing protein [Bisporella sp. PMI_857]|nr:aflatoxin regulatory protein-domain-containing protein [Bisporella sp. PMI_857]